MIYFTFIDLRILCLPADTHSSCILGTLLKAHPGNMLCSLQAWASCCSMGWGAGFGEGSAHICFMTVSIKVSTQIRATLMVTQGLKCSIPQQFTSSRVIEQQQTQTVACRGLYSLKSGQLLWIDESLPVPVKIFKQSNPWSQELQLFSFPWGQLTPISWAGSQGAAKLRGKIGKVVPWLISLLGMMS